MRNPVYFADPPSHAELKLVADAYTTALNAVMAHMTKLARGEIRPATLFDTSTVTLPAVPELRRAELTEAPPESVRLPDFAAVPFAPSSVGGIDPFLSQLAAAEAVIEQLGLRYTLTNVSGIDSLALSSIGHVRAQYPLPGSVVPLGSTVTLEV
jgi:hypothetical protein